MKKDAVLAQIRAERVIGLSPALPADILIACAQAMAVGGLHCLELAMTTPAVLSAIERASTALPEFRFGLGTVLDVDTARLGLLAGASFIVTPGLRPEVITLCRRFNVPVFSGASTIAEIAAARQAGADAAKVFPGELFGPAHLRAVQQADPAIPLIPIGGVTPATIAEFIRAGALAGVAGSALIEPKFIEERDWDALASRAAEFRSAVTALTEPTPSGAWRG